MGDADSKDSLRIFGKGDTALKGLQSNEPSDCSDSIVDIVKDCKSRRPMCQAGSGGKTDGM